MASLLLLGRPALQDNSVPLRLHIKRSWALLALLAVGGPASRARLSALLWPGLDEATARRNLRRELARLREAGTGDLIQTEGDFLALQPGIEVDVRRFELDLREQRPAAALAVWRGPLADGLELGDAPEFDGWLVAERERLRGVWRGALDAAATGAAAAGDAAAALRHREALLADDPLQERHHLALMRLHTAAGHGEAALAQYDRCRSLLQTELGLAPMADTEALAASLRGASAAHDARPGVPPGALQPIALDRLPEQLPFVGREAEVAALETAWRAGRAVLIEGEGGVGKSRLALDFVAAHGPYALARCRPGDADVPYAGFTRALRALAGPRPDLTNLPPWVAGELARLLPELGPAPQPLQSDEQRARFFEAIALGWQALAADNFDAVVLDDWHHADVASQTLLVFVAQRRRELAPSGAREWLLLRPELGASAVQRLCDGLQALHIRLPPLDVAAGFELLKRLSGARSPALFASRLQQATGGNPFFLGETLRHLVEQGLLAAGTDGVWRTPFDDATEDYRELPVPASVRDAVLARVRRLPAAVLRVLEAAALAAEPFAPALLAPACALSELDTVLAIEQGVEAQLLREHEAGGFAFVHDLVQQALDTALPAERRRLVHRRLALGAEAAGAPAATVAAHHEASGERRRAVPHRLLAGKQARRLHLLPLAVRQWQQALADDPTPAQQMALHLLLMRSTLWLHRIEDSQRHADAALALATDPTLTDAERIDSLIAVATHLAQNRRAAESLALVDKLPPVLDERQQARAMLARVHGLRETGQRQPATAAARAALAMPGLQGRDRADLLDAMVLVEQQAGNLQAALAWLDASVAIGIQLGDEFGILRGRYRRGVFLTELGDLQAAEAELQVGLADSTRLGVTANQAALHYSLSRVYRLMRRPADALAAARQVWALLAGSPPSLLSLMVRLELLHGHTALGELGEAWAHAGPAVAQLLALDQKNRVEAACALALDLFACLGAADALLPLRTAVESAILNGEEPCASVWWRAIAELALVTAEPAQARQALNRAAALAGAPPAAVMALCQARLALAEFNPALALATLPAPDDAGLDAEHQVRGWTVRLRAQALLQPAPLPAAQTAAARAVLAAPGVPTLAALALLRELAGAPGAAPKARQAFAELVDRLAGSLAAYPEQQAAFYLWAAGPPGRLGRLSLQSHTMS